MEIDMTERTYLENLTDAELAERLAKLEEMGKATAARIASGERSEIVTYAIVRGRQVGINRLEAGLNTQRSAWKQTRQEIRNREAAAAQAALDDFNYVGSRHHY
jgi:hypothetical protein